MGLHRNKNGRFVSLTEIFNGSSKFVLFPEGCKADGLWRVFKELTELGSGLDPNSGSFFVSRGQEGCGSGPSVSEMARRSASLSLKGCCPNCGLDLSGVVSPAQVMQSEYKGFWTLTVKGAVGEDGVGTTRERSGSEGVEVSEGLLDSNLGSNLKPQDSEFEVRDGKGRLGPDPFLGRVQPSSLSLKGARAKKLAQ